MPGQNTASYRIAGAAQLVVAAAGLGFAGFGLHEILYARMGTGGQVFFGLISLVVALLTIQPFGAADALFRRSPHAYRKAAGAKSGCGVPLMVVFALGLVALGRSISAGEALTQTLPFLVAIVVAGGLVLAADVLAVRATGGPSADGIADGPAWATPAAEAAVRAADGRLGELVRGYWRAALDPAVIRRLFLIASAGVVVGVGGGGIGGLFAGRVVGLTLLGIGAILVLAAMVTKLRMPERRTAAVLFARGLVMVENDRADVIPFAGVSGVYAATRQLRGQNNTVRVARTYTIHRPAGQGDPVVLDEGFGAVGDLGAAVETGVAQALLPAAGEAIDAGRSWGFGPLKIDRTGILAADRRYDFAAGAEIAVLDGTLHVNASAAPPFTVPAGQVANLRLLLTLTDALRRHATPPGAANA